MKRLLSRHSANRRPARRQQMGAMVVEFALVSLIFLTILIGVMEFGRWLFTLNAAAEATRWGARLAVVCDPTVSQRTAIKNRLQATFGSVADWIEIDYSPTGCTKATCTSVTVSLDDEATFTPLIPFFGVPISMPSFPTTLTTESLDSASGGNDVCP